MKYLYLLFSFALIACGGSNTTVSNVDTPQDVKNATEAGMYCADIIEMSELPDSLKMAQATIINYKEVEGCVCITYQYSGCTEGKTLLTYDSEFQESNRPEVNMVLGVADAGLCDQMLTDSACFSMKKMQLIGNQVLIYINREENNLLLNFEDRID